MANEEVLLHSDFLKFPCSWSPDGRFILYFNNENSGDLMVLPLGGDRKPYPFAATPFSEGEGVFSPDGKWVAYTSNESGHNEIYVRPFPGPGAAYAVSVSGGSSPRWRRDGKELYFLSPDSKLMATPVEMRGAAFATGTPQALFTVHPVFAPGKQQYDVTRDGRFLVVIELGTTEPIHILLNWKRPQ